MTPRFTVQVLERFPFPEGILMKFPSRLERTQDAQWSIQTESPEIGSVRVTAPTRDEAVEKLIGEIRYRLELCPCSGESYQHVALEISEAS
jgi:hypothetical protein